ncbi:(S,S)-butanediol dehydrogenase [Microdochium nivale]|nr:(S,S)-butanediol dehydrogenase [Microdochium nivale]
MSVVTVNPETFGQLADRVVVVTGGSSGIGLAAVRLLLSNGAKVVNVDQNDGPVSQSQDVSSYQFVKADVASWSELRGALSLPSTLSVSLIMCLRMLASGPDQIFSRRMSTPKVS